jgi:hypothetical protein
VDDQQGGAALVHFRGGDDSRKADFITGRPARLADDPESTVAVLYRTNAQRAPLKMR